MPGPLHFRLSSALGPNPLGPGPEINHSTDEQRERFKAWEARIASLPKPEHPADTARRQADEAETEGRNILSVDHRADLRQAHRTLRDAQDERQRVTDILARAEAHLDAVKAAASGSHRTRE